MKFMLPVGKRRRTTLWLPRRPERAAKAPSRKGRRYLGEARLIVERVDEGVI
jgi:hypothetical protein